MKYWCSERLFLEHAWCRPPMIGECAVLRHITSMWLPYWGCPRSSLSSHSTRWAQGGWQSAVGLFMQNMMYACSGYSGHRRQA